MRCDTDGNLWCGWGMGDPDLDGELWVRGPTSWALTRLPRDLAGELVPGEGAVALADKL